jgi:hypothetical protein
MSKIWNLKSRVETIEKKLDEISNTKNYGNVVNDSYVRHVEKTLLIGDDYAILRLIDEFSEKNNKCLKDYFSKREVLSKLDKKTLEGSIARFKGMEEELDNSKHLAPAITMMAAYLSSYIAVIKGINAKTFGWIMLIILAGVFLALILSQTKIGRKGRKRLVFFRTLLEYELFGIGQNKATSKTNEL